MISMASGTGQHMTESGEVVEHKLFGIKIELDPAIASDGLRNILSDGRYERTEGELLLRALDDDRTHSVLELGGGIGFVSALLCRRCSIRSYHLVEANPDLIPVIRRTHE